MESSIRLLDFETLDQMIQVHGKAALSFHRCNTQSAIADYEGVSMFGRTANQKAAASEATTIFQNHYPEFLVRPVLLSLPAPLLTVTAVQEALHPRPGVPDMDVLDLQAYHLG